METKFNFKSNPCTSREQSERLLALGLKKETADMSLCYMTHDICGKEMEPRFLGCIAEPMQCEEIQTILFSRQKFYPAWSLHRLIEMTPSDMRGYMCKNIFDEKYAIDEQFDELIATIGYYIKEGYFNKEYLENGNC